MVLKIPRIKLTGVFVILLSVLVCIRVLSACSKDDDEAEPEEPDTHEIVIRAHGAEGTETIQLRIDSITVDTFILSTSFAEYSAETDSGLIRVYFTNAGNDREVQVDYVKLDRLIYEAEDQPVNTAVLQDDICGGSYSEYMHCNGYIQFDVISDIEVVVAADAAIIDLSDNKQIIRGFGGATVFRPTVPLTDEELDLIFGVGDGQIGLNILRIRIASDNDPGWRSLELSNALGAIERGAIVIASPWSPPARMKSNGSLVGGYLNAESYAEYATYLNDFANYMSANEADLYALSIQNEPDIQVSYESCDWSSGMMRDFLRDHGSAITSTRVVAPESYNFNQNYSNVILNDEGAAENVDIIGGHIYGSGIADYPLAREKGKEVWMTEHLDTAIRWEAVFATAKEIHDCLANANFSAYIWWYVKRFYGPLGEDNVLTKRGYIMSNYSKFITPGDYRVEATENPKPDIYVSAYKGIRTVIVAINQRSSVTAQQFVFFNGTVSSVTPYITSLTDDLSKRPDVSVVGNAFTYSLPGESVVTFVQKD